MVNVRTFIIFPFLIAFIVGMIILQIFLSKRENKWAGLILPIISFSISLLALLGAVMYLPATVTEFSFVNGELVEQTVTPFVPTSTIISTAIFTFLVFNIPTVINLIIYAVCRDKYSKKRDLEKMRIQDLE